MTAVLCRLCGHTVAAHSMVRGYRLNVCENCHFVQVDPVPSDAELTAFYAMTYFEKGKYRNDTAGQREQSRRLELLRRAGVPAGGRVLDFGCATGEFLVAACSRYEVWGADISKDALATVAKTLPEAADRLIPVSASGRLTCQKVPKFDAIVAWDVLEHLVDPAGVLTELAGLLKPGGVLCASTPDIGAPAARLMGSRWAFMTPPEHLGFFSKASVVYALEDAGLQPRRRFSRGKWANIGFILYKMRRVFPTIPERIVSSLGRGALGQLCLYVPTGDVLYVVARNPQSGPLPS